MKKNARTSQKRLPAAARIGLMLVAVLILFNGYTLAKYLFQKQGEPAFQAKSFYFDSDLLQVPNNVGEFVTHTLQPGAENFTFTLKNFPDSTQNRADKLRYSEVDIDYTVTLTKDGVSVGSQTNGTLTGGAQTSLPISISLDDLKPGNYVVTAAATGPYIQTLKAGFVITEPDNSLSWSVSDSVGSPVLMVTFSTGDKGGSLTINWPDDVLPDNTDPLMEAASETSYTITNYAANSEYQLRFFKTDITKVYQNADFTIALSN